MFSSHNNTEVLQFLHHHRLPWYKRLYKYLSPLKTSQELLQEVRHMSSQLSAGMDKAIALNLHVLLLAGKFLMRITTLLLAFPLWNLAHVLLFISTARRKRLIVQTVGDSKSINAPLTSAKYCSPILHPLNRGL